MKVYQEDCEDFMKESKTYKTILEHRMNCKKWGKKFCLDCFGGGLTRFTKELDRERHLSTFDKQKGYNSRFPIRYGSSKSKKSITKI